MLQIAKKYSLFPNGNREWIDEIDYNFLVDEHKMQVKIGRTTDKTLTDWITISQLS